MSTRAHSVASVPALILAGLVAAVWPGAVQAAHVPRELLVEFGAELTRAEQDAILDARGAARGRILGRTDWQLVRLADDETVEDALPRWSTTNGVRHVQPNYIYEALTPPNDPRFGEQWYLHNTGQNGCAVGADIDALAGWGFQSAAPDVVIGVVDTGLNYNHPDCSANLWHNPGEVWNGEDDGDVNSYVDDMIGYDFGDYYWDPIGIDWVHGTNVAGVIAATGNNGVGIAGVAWQAKLVALRAAAQCFGLTSAGIVLALGYAIEIDADIVNLSLGDQQLPDSALFSALDLACDAGIVVVVAAGNRGENIDVNPRYPAAFDFPCMIVVGMTDCHDVFVTAANACESGALSNFGPVAVDLAAPGRSVLTTTTDPTTTPPTYMYWPGCGTSVAAPIVTGAAALLLSQNPTWTNAQVKERILGTVDQLESLHGMVLTHGRLNLRKALDNQAPEAIDDLDVTMGRTTAMLTWTAPGDNGNEGTASAYEVACSTSPITAENFYFADTVFYHGPPQASGGEECCDISGLQRCRAYYFAVRTWDDAFNLSGVSNVPTGYRCDGSYAQVYCAEGLMVEGSGTEGWTPENAVTFDGLCELSQTSWPTDWRPQVRVLMLGGETIKIDRLGLGQVDHDPTLAAVAAGDSCVVGRLEQAMRIESLKKGDISAQLNAGGRGVFALAGDIVTVTLGDTIPNATWLVIESAATASRSDAGSVGMLVQAKGEAGAWQTLEHVWPRKFFSRVAINARGFSTLRLLCLGCCSIRSVKRMTAVWSGTAEALDLVEALHTREGAVGSVIGESDGAAISLSRGDTLQVAFKPGALAQGKARTYFLSTAGYARSATIGAGLEPAVATVSRHNYVLSLGPARPNPGLGSVTISYSLAQESPVSIRVFNVAGRLVRTLVSGTGEAGPHDVVWDARDDGGRAVPAGVYFYRMTAGSWQSQRKVVFLER